MQKKIGVILVVSFLTGCATPVYNYQAQSKQMSKPPIGSINTAYVGDKMLEQGVFTDREVLRVDSPTKVNMFYSLTPGNYLKTGQSNQGIFYSAFNQIENGGNVQKNPLADPIKALMLSADGKLCVVSVLNAKNCTNQHQAKTSVVGVASDNSFQQTLIYSGKVGQKINIGYREFSSNLARPAFNNDVEYDLNDSFEIGYKGALLEILDANNQKITYRVIRNFNK
ncbi:hypothetical protein [Acinetobacter shaoyimingii]|uniref:Lipoprotein n=1 Tax=Acinetobacter shaoyimingii TaxID=2715164 RepID=A0A6G8RUN9_9GAMM|nr:hypothetical protein [Acinetobacter shaoyimingii]NHB58164.1 hypothetical protein [Acinetobacter shaoyimingii]QIO05605.1 hypothetical protein G8E00_06380 [Acinetobacter shaoyimingii]